MPEELVALPLSGVKKQAAALERFHIRGEEFRRLFNPTYRTIWPFTEEQAAVLLQETGFVPESSVVEGKWDPELAEAVGTGVKECPKCKDTNWVAVDHQGVETGVRVTKDVRCRCYAYKRFYDRWYNPRNVGKEYRKVRKQDLIRFAANFGTFDRNPADSNFQKLLDTINQFPMNCYLLAGPHGLGKTTLLTAMYRHALEQWIGRAWQLKDWTEAVWIANATTLASEFRAWELKDEGRDRETGKPTPLPTIWERKILSAIQAGHTPCIFIEEFDKWKLDSDFQRKEFARVIDAVHSATGQIVVSSNLNERALRLRLGDQYGGGIIRRIAGHRGNEGVDPTYDAEGVRLPGKPDSSKSGFYINFWNGTITHPLTWEAPQEGLTHAPESNASEAVLGSEASSREEIPNTSAAPVSQTPAAQKPLPKNHFDPEPGKKPGPSPASVGTAAAGKNTPDKKPKHIRDLRKDNSLGFSVAKQVVLD